MRGMQSPCDGAESSALPQGLISLWRCSTKHFLMEGQPSLLPGYCLAAALRKIPGASLEENVSGIFRLCKLVPGAALRQSGCRLLSATHHIHALTRQIRVIVSLPLIGGM